MLLTPSVDTAPNVFVDVVGVVDVELDALGVIEGVVVVGDVVDGSGVVSAGLVDDGVVVTAGAGVCVGLTTTVFPALPVVLSCE